MASPGSCSGLAGVSAGVVGLLLAVLLVGGCDAPANGRAGELITAGELRLEIDVQGNLTSLADTQGREFLAKEDVQPLISLMVAASPQQEATEAVRYSPLSWRYEPVTSRYVFAFADDISVSVRADDHNTYLTLSVESVDNPGGKDIRVVYWGPLVTTITDYVADSLGVVYTNDFAIGAQALNPKTIGGWPLEYADLGFKHRMVDKPGQWQRASRYRFENSAARVIDAGSLLQFYSRDYSTTRRYDVFLFRDEGAYRRVEPLLDRQTGELSEDALLPGSGIALFGVSSKKEPGRGETRLDVIRDTILDVVADIEVEQGLPHLLYDGEWGKRSDAVTQPYLILGDLDRNSIGEAVAWAKRAGMGTIYKNTQRGLFDRVGDYPVGSEFDGDDPDSTGSYAELAEVIAVANHEGVEVGSHSLSNFVSTQGPWVTPEASPQLAWRGRDHLLNALGEADTDIVVADEKIFTWDTRAGETCYVRLGGEIASYTGVSMSTAEVRLTGVERGVFGTIARPHEVGSDVDRLFFVGGGYQMFLGGYELLDDVAKGLTDAINATGIRVLSLDGLEGTGMTGYGIYGLSSFVRDFLNRLDRPDGFVFDASLFSHYGWHAINRLNWGEVHGVPVWEAHRALRWSYQAFYVRNMIPRMMGWYRIEPDSTLHELEWAYSKAVSFDAGYGLHTDLEILDNKPDAGSLLEAAKTWRQAQQAGAFSDGQRFRMRDMFSFWHLETLEEGRRWQLWQVNHETLQRHAPEIVERPAAGHPLYNIAPSAKVSVSSYLDNSFTGTRLTDGQTGAFSGKMDDPAWPRPGGERDEAISRWQYFPGIEGSGEWVSDGELEPWALLQWNSPQQIEKILLFDRARHDQNARRGRLTFSDGSEIELADIPPNGSHLAVSFAPKRVDWVRVELSGEGSNVGLAEMVVLARP